MPINRKTPVKAAIREAIAQIGGRFSWASEHHRSTRGQKLTFAKSDFLIDIYRALEREREVCVIKSVQCGLSEALIVSHLYEAAQGLAILYVLPKQATRNTFVANRVNRLLSAVPFYRGLLRQPDDTIKRSVDSVIFKQFGAGVIKYVDANSRDNFVEYPADALYIDELDEMDQDIIELAPQRLESSTHKLIRAVANPTVDGYGISARYNDSSRAEWYIRCQHCNTWQTLDFFVNVVREVGNNKYELRNEHSEPVCKKCEKVLDRYARGEFLHERDCTVKGFRVNKIFGSVNTTMVELTNAFFSALNNETKLQIFHNTGLGVPYTSASAKVTDVLLDACNVPDCYEAKGAPSGAVVVMGVDVGKVLHYVIRQLLFDGMGEVAGYMLLKAGTCASESDLRKLEIQYNVKRSVIDAQPETRMVERYKGISKNVYSCFYSDTARYDTNNQDERVITVNRTARLDELLEKLRGGKIRNFANMKTAVPDYYDNLEAIVRVYDAPSDKYRWVRVRADHYAHAEVYALIAAGLCENSSMWAFYRTDSAQAKADEIKSISPEQIVKQAEQDAIKAKQDEQLAQGKNVSTVLSDIAKNFYNRGE